MHLPVPHSVNTTFQRTPATLSETNECRHYQTFSTISRPITGFMCRGPNSSFSSWPSVRDIIYIRYIYTMQSRPMIPYCFDSVVGCCTTGTMAMPQEMAVGGFWSSTKSRTPFSTHNTTSQPPRGQVSRDTRYLSDHHLDEDRQSK